jgi:hypothetical protein
LAQQSGRRRPRKIKKSNGKAARLAKLRKASAKRQEYLRTKDVGPFLAEHGFPYLSLEALYALSSRGGGPPFRKWRRRYNLYEPETTLTWAVEQLGPRLTSTEVGQ